MDPDLPPEHPATLPALGPRVGRLCAWKDRGAPRRVFVPKDSHQPLHVLWKVLTYKVPSTGSAATQSSPRSVLWLELMRQMTP